MKTGDRVIYDEATRSIVRADAAEPATLPQSAIVVDTFPDGTCTLYLYPNVPDAVRERVPLPLPPKE